MGNDKIFRMITDKCDIYYDDALLSKEKIIEDYLAFFADQFNSDERSVSFAFHTGSICFDVAAIAAVMIGCLAYEFSSNDEILSSLQSGDLVLFRKERYRWVGIETKSLAKNVPERKYIILKQDAIGNDGESIKSVSYDRNKHLIKPYYGSSTATDGKGLRKDTTNRNDFISHVMDIPTTDVPSSIDISVVIVADKNEFIEICRHMRICYKKDKFVSLTDVFPVSYFTGSGEEFQIGMNQSKAEAVIKVTSKISTARDLVLDKHGNKVIGLLISNRDSLTDNSSELNDLLRRKSLKFVYFIAPYNGDSCHAVIEQHTESKVFACTKDFLSSANQTIHYPSMLTNELNRQISNILNREIHKLQISGVCSWEFVKRLKERILAVKQSNWSGELRDNFILSSLALLNLFTTSFFPLRIMEQAIADVKINSAIVSPESRLTELQNIASGITSLNDLCNGIVSDLTDMYSDLYNFSPKGEYLDTLIQEFNGKKVVIIVPKAYYSEIYSNYFEKNANITCVTANHFNNHEKYDVIIAVGDIIGRHFDALQCYSAKDVYVLLYEYEEKTFVHREKASSKAEKILNARIKGLTGDDYINATIADEPDEINEHTMREFSDLDDFVNSLNIFDIRKLASSYINPGNNLGTSEVKFIGTFTSGEQILFSKYYSAVIFDQGKGEIIETSPDKLSPGDILVFTKRNDYTKNIVDQIFDQLVASKKLSTEVSEAAAKSFYWKETLRNYKEKNNLSYRELVKELKKLGSTLSEVTIRQWLIEESHIVGPLKADTMRLVATLTQDSNLLSDPEGYFEACRTVRHYRREILSFIAQAINDKLSNKNPTEGSAFEVVYENVDKLSDTMELENIFELDEIANINIGMVNRPISGNEVTL